MTRDLINFSLLFFLIVVVFSTIGSSLLADKLQIYKDFFTSIQTVINVSVGNYSLKFESLNAEYQLVA